MLPRSVTLLFILFISSLNAFAQNDTLEYYLDYHNKKCEPYMAYYYRLAVKDGSGWNVKDYYIKEQTLQMSGRYNDDSLKIKHGTFRFYHTNGKLKETVRYIFNKKDGLVKEYDSLGKIVDSGYYKNGIPYKTRRRTFAYLGRITTGVYDDSGKGTGREWYRYDSGELEDYGITSEGYKKDSIWSYYYKNGKVSSLEYFDKGTLLKRECFDETGLKLAQGCDSLVMPVFSKHGGDFNQYLNNNVQFPSGVEITGSGGISIIAQYTVTEDGTVSDVVIIKGVHPLFDKEVLFVLRNSPKWTPARYQNHPVSIHYTIPFAFKMTD